jgi:hypothetical protein
VRGGETLRDVARSLYGDETLWYVIAQANGLTAPDGLAAGTTLKIPSVTRASNTASTFKVYNAGEAIGSTAPDQIAPPPPPGKEGGCGGVGKLLIVVVAVVATVYTAGAASIYFGAGSGMGATALGAASVGEIFAAGAAALGGGGVVGVGAAAGVATPLTITGGVAATGAALGGAVGSILGQGVGLSTGVQDEFSWKNVGLAALGAAVTSSIGALSGGAAAGNSASFLGISKTGNAMLYAAARGVTNSLVTQGLGSAMGLQSFSWKAIAVSAITAPLNAAINENGLNDLLKDTNSFVRDSVTGIVNGALAQSVRIQVYSDGKVDWASIAGDAFGNAIGNGVVNSMQPTGTAFANGLADHDNDSRYRLPLSHALCDDEAPNHNVADPLAVLERSRRIVDADPTYRDLLAEQFRGFGVDWEMADAAAGGAPYLIQPRADFRRDLDQQLRGGESWSKRSVSPAFEQLITDQTAQGNHVAGFLLTMLKTPAEGSADLFSGMASFARLLTSSEKRAEFYDSIRSIGEDPGAFLSAAWNKVAENTWYENLEGAYKVFQGGAVAFGVGRLGRLGALSELNGLGGNTLRVLGRYQSVYDEAYLTVTKDISDRVLKVHDRLPEKLFIGREVDDFARREMRLFARDEGLSNDALRINRRLYDPEGTGQYRVPDLYLPDERTIIDGTIGKKTIDTEQIRKFFEYGNGNVERVILVTPNQKPIIFTLEQFMKSQRR